MATAAVTINRNIAKGNACMQASWANMANGDVGAWVSFADFSSKTFQVNGTFGAGGTVVIEGSNDATNPTNVNTLTNWQATALTTTVAAFLTARDMPIWVRPHVTAGDGTTAITVTCAMHRADISDFN